MSSSAAVDAAVMGDLDRDLDRFLMRQLGALEVDEDMEEVLAAAT